jgi:hypothetical protein
MVRPAARHPNPASARRAARAVAGAAAALLLAGCGALATLVPPQSVGDPLGVDGRVVTAVLDEGVIEAQGTTHLDETRTFDVPDLEANLYGFRLASFHTNVGLADEIWLSGPTVVRMTDHPERITVARVLIEAELSDDVNGSARFTHDARPDLTFERTHCTLDGCAYGFVGTGTLADVLDVEVTDAAMLDRFVAILILGDTPTPNRGTFRVAIELEAERSLEGYVATFRLISNGSTIRLGG